MSQFSLIVRTLILTLAITYGSTARAQAFVDIEPNDACLAAQDLGMISLPSTVIGSLDSTIEIPDVDFFSFRGVPGENIQVDLEGSYTGAGTLPDPYLGLFNSDCALLAISDDSGGGLNSRLTVVVPEDGIVVLGVTTCCDSGFVGGGVGSYLLSMNQVLTIHSISGQLVNANTGDPLPGSDSPYAYVQLSRCSATGCFEYVGFQQAGPDGSFYFDLDQFGNPLTVGTYQIQAYANGFEALIGDPFFVGEGEMRDLGVLGLQPLQLVGSISGRMVDSVTGNVLAGNVPPYPYLYLQRCEVGYCYIVASIVPDDMGRFRFDGISYYLSPGTYQLIGFAEEYEATTSAEFDVAAFEDVDIGDFAITPLPIQFGAVKGCEIPPGGGSCEYSIDITNRSAGQRFRGQAWSIVEYFAPAPTYRVTRFQVGRGGVDNPRPEKINLRRGEAATLTFQLDVPDSVPDGSTVCAWISVGQAPMAQFNSQGDRFISCSQKQSGAVAPMSEKEGRKRLRELKNRTRVPAETRVPPATRVPADGGTH